MAKVRYRIREFKPTANQTGGHSVYAEAVVDNIITTKVTGKGQVYFINKFLGDN